MAHLTPVPRYTTGAAVILECGHGYTMHTDGVSYYRRLCRNQRTRVHCPQCPDGLNKCLISDVIMRHG